MRSPFLGLLLLAAGSCARLHIIEAREAGLLRVGNASSSTIYVEGRDDLGHGRTLGRVAPWGYACYYWPYHTKYGYLIARSEDQTQADIQVRFEPLSAQGGWSWVPGKEPRVGSGGCA